MICRMWTGKAADPDAYVEVFRTEVMAELAAVPGFLGAHLLRGPAGEVIALTMWESLDDVRAFAGDDYEKANISAPARAVLSAFDSRARHYDVAVVATREPGPQQSEIQR